MANRFELSMIGLAAFAFSPAPRWNPKGKQLFYRSEDKMLAVGIVTQPGFAAGTPRMLFEGRYEPAPGPVTNYDVSPGGQRFLMIKPVEQGATTPTQINVVLNWFEELKQKVPTGKKWIQRSWQ